MSIPGDTLRATTGGRTPSAAVALLLLGALLLCRWHAAALSPSEPSSYRHGPVTVIHSPEDEALAKEVARIASERHRRIRADLGLESKVEATVLLMTESLANSGYDDPARDLPPWFAGAAWAGRELIVLRVRRGDNSRRVARLVAHELTHVILKVDYPGLPSWPLWFQEGLAMREAGGEGLRGSAALSLAALRRRLIPLDSLWTSFPADEAGSRLAYAQSFSVISFLLSQYGRERFLVFMKELRSDDFETALRNVYGFGTGSMEGEWRRYAVRRYSWVPLATGGSAFWILTMVIFVLALAARRRRSRLIEKRWEEEEGWPPRFPW